MTEDDELRNVRSGRLRAVSARSRSQIREAGDTAARYRMLQFSRVRIKGGSVAGKPRGNQRLGRVKGHEIGQSGL